MSRKKYKVVRPGGLGRSEEQLASAQTLTGLLERADFEEGGPYRVVRVDGWPQRETEIAEAETADELVRKLREKAGHRSST